MRGEKNESQHHSTCACNVLSIAGYCMVHDKLSDQQQLPDGHCTCDILSVAGGCVVHDLVYQNQ